MFQYYQKSFVSTVETYKSSDTDDIENKLSINYHLCIPNFSLRNQLVYEKLNLPGAYCNLLETCINAKQIKYDLNDRNF